MIIVKWCSGIQCNWCVSMDIAKMLAFICGRLIVEHCEVLITATSLWCFIIININGTKLIFGATEMKSQAYAPPIWHHGPCLPVLQPGRDFFASGSRVFSVGAYDFQLSNFVSRVMFEVLRNVNQGLTITPNIYTNVKSQSQWNEWLLCSCAYEYVISKTNIAKKLFVHLTPILSQFNILICFPCWREQLRWDGVSLSDSSLDPDCTFHVDVNSCGEMVSPCLTPLLILIVLSMLTWTAAVRWCLPVWLLSWSWLYFPCWREQLRWDGVSLSYSSLDPDCTFHVDVNSCGEMVSPCLTPLLILIVLSMLTWTAAVRWCLPVLLLSWSWLYFPCWREQLRWDSVSLSDSSLDPDCTFHVDVNSCGEMVAPCVTPLLILIVLSMLTWTAAVRWWLPVLLLSWSWLYFPCWREQLRWDGGSLCYSSLDPDCTFHVDVNSCGEMVAPCVTPLLILIVLSMLTWTAAVRWCLPVWLLSWSWLYFPCWREQLRWDGGSLCYSSLDPDCTFHVDVNSCGEMVAPCVTPLLILIVLSMLTWTAAVRWCLPVWLLSWSWLYFPCWREQLRWDGVSLSYSSLDPDCTFHVDVNSCGEMVSPCLTPLLILIVLSMLTWTAAVRWCLPVLLLSWSWLYFPCWREQLRWDSVSLSDSSLDPDCTFHVDVNSCGEMVAPCVTPLLILIVLSMLTWTAAVRWWLPVLLLSWSWLYFPCWREQLRWDGGSLCYSSLDPDCTFHVDVNSCGEMVAPCVTPLLILIALSIVLLSAV